VIVKKSLGINLVSAKITKDTFSLIRFHPLNTLISNFLECVEELIYALYHRNGETLPQISKEYIRVK